jgi:probable HAF family extracellular repeat protein
MVSCRTIPSKFARYCLLMIAIALLLGSAIKIVHSQSQNMPTIVDLTPNGSGIAIAVNAFGQVVGRSGTHAFSWTAAGGMVDIGTLGGNDSEAESVNDSGQVIGGSYTACCFHAFSWTPSTGMIDLGTLGGDYSEADAVSSTGQVVGNSSGERAYSWTATGGMVELPRLGGTTSDAFAVNTAGYVAGDSSLANGDTHPVLWTPTGSVIDLGTLGGSWGYAAALNDNLQIVGQSAVTPESQNEIHAFSWTPTGGMIDLGTLGGTFSYAVAVNAIGQVAGVSGTVPGDRYCNDIYGNYTGNCRVFLWSASRGMVDLGTLGGRHSFIISPPAINNSGQVIGVSYTAAGELHGFSWTASGGMIDLGTLGGNSSFAVAVNNTGFIVGESKTASGSSHAVVWMPPPNTPVGNNVSVQSGGVTVTFQSVVSAGNTTITGIDPFTIGQASGGFAVSELVADQITTTAAFTGPITIAFVVPGPLSQTDFNALSIYHNDNGILVDVTASSPLRNYASLTLYATTNTLSPFYLVRRNVHVSALFDQSRAYRSGSTIPIKVQLLNSNNVNVSTSNTVLTTRNLRLIGGTTSIPVIDSGNANPDMNFRYDSTIGATGGYIFNLSTKGFIPGRYILSFYAGADHSYFYTIGFEVR